MSTQILAEQQQHVVKSIPSATMLPSQSIQGNLIVDVLKNEEVLKYEEEEKYPLGLGDIT